MTLFRYADIFRSKYIAMNNLISKFLLEGEKFMPEMHLKQKTKKSKGTGNCRYIYKTERENTYFRQDMTYRDFND